MKKAIVSLGAFLVLLGGSIRSANAVTLVSRSSDDTWIAQYDPTSNFDGDSSPSTQLRDFQSPDRIRASLYKFPLPALPAGEVVTSVDLRMVVNGGGEQYWNVSIGKLADNPNLSTINWNSATAAGYLSPTGDTVGSDGLHYLFGPNSTGTNNEDGEWVVPHTTFSDGSIKIYSDTDASDGLAKDIKDSMGLSSVDITLMLNPRGNNADQNNALFYGEGSGESPNASDPGLDALYIDDGGSSLGFYPRAYLIITTQSIPEPASLSLLAIGGVAALARRRGDVRLER